MITIKHIIAAVGTTAVMLTAVALPKPAFAGFVSTAPEIDEQNFFLAESDQPIENAEQSLSLASEFTEKSFELKDFYQFPVQSDNFFGYSQKFGRFHRGFDIRARFRSDIKSITTGVVESIGFERGGYGRYIVVNHENGLSSLYAHLDKTFVKVGDRIGLETVIGTVGLSGRTTGPHIHFEVYRDGKVINPVKILPAV